MNAENKDQRDRGLSGRLFAALRTPSIWIVLTMTVIVSCGAAAANSMFALPPIEKTVAVEGLSFAVPIRLEASFAGRGVKLRVTVSLAGLQEQAAPILHALAARKSRCETRWSFPELATPIASGGRLRIAGTVRAEFWLCGLVKTKLGRDTADFTLAVFPLASPEAISVRAELDRFDLGPSLLADLGLEDELRNTIEAELNRTLAGDSADFAFPPEIAALGPKFTGVELRDNAGIAEIGATAEATADAATILKLIQLFN